MNVTDVSIGIINCDPNNADRGRSIIRVTSIVCDIFRKRLSFNMDWRILVNFIPRFCLGIKY
jgi:hypothetical protein